jgi:hypothetical protein
VVIAAEAAVEYGFKDFSGKQPPSLRERLSAPLLQAIRRFVFEAS